MNRSVQSGIAEVPKPDIFHLSPSHAEPKSWMGLQLCLSSHENATRLLQSGCVTNLAIDRFLQGCWQRSHRTHNSCGHAQQLTVCMPKMALPTPTRSQWPPMQVQTCDFYSDWGPPPRPHGDGLRRNVDCRSHGHAVTTDDFELRLAKEQQSKLRRRLSQRRTWTRLMLPCHTWRSESACAALSMWNPVL